MKEHNIEIWMRNKKEDLKVYILELSWTYEHLVKNTQNENKTLSLHQRVWYGMKRLYLGWKI